MERRRNEADGRGGEGGNGAYMYAWNIRRQEVYQHDSSLEGKIIYSRLVAFFFVIEYIMHGLHQIKYKGGHAANTTVSFLIIHKRHLRPPTPH
jgi:hypothetical protein